MVIYYTGILLLLLFLSYKRESKVLTLTVLLIVSTEYLLFDQWYNSLDVGFYLSGIINETFACILLLTLYNWHKNKRIFIPFLLALLLNSVYQYYIYNTPLEGLYTDEVYYYSNMVLFEVIVLICLLETTLPDAVCLLKDRFITYIEGYVGVMRIIVIYNMRYLVC